MSCLQPLHDVALAAKSQKAVTGVEQCTGGFDLISTLSGHVAGSCLWFH